MLRLSNCFHKVTTNTFINLHVNLWMSRGFTYGLNNKDNQSMKPTYLKLFGYELMIEPSGRLTFEYVKDSPTERELYLGRVKVIISG